MRHLMLLLALVAVLVVPGWGLAQAPAPTTNALLKCSFDADPGGWVTPDGAGEIAITQEAALIRSKEGGGVLQYSYTPAPGQFTAVLTPTETGLGGGKSVHFWLKTSAPALMLCALIEKNEARYESPFMSLPNQWQEIDLDFSEFHLADDSRDDNGRLDPGEVKAVAVGDLSIFLAQMAEKVPFLVAPEAGPRKLWLDDFEVSATGVEPRWKAVQLNGKPAVQLDSFERAPLQWMVLMGKGIDLAYDKDHKTDGQFSLRVHYQLPQGKIFGTMTLLAGVPLQGCTGLSLAVMSKEATTLLVELKEKNEQAKYQTLVQIPAGQELQVFNVPVAQFKLADDGNDPDGRLDMDQLKELTIADASPLTGTPMPENTLWFDNIVFTK